MRVSITDTKPVILGEMQVDSYEVGHIAEMVNDPAKLDTFQPGWSAKGAALAQQAGDETPEFAVLRVEEGWSRSNRLWTASELQSIAEQTNRLEPVGNLGHIEDDKAATAFGDPQTTWFGAFTRVEPSQNKDHQGEMVTTAYFAGYNYAGAKVRQLIKARAVRGISWWGRGEQVPVPGKGVQVKGFKLLALDWARKLSEGMPTSSIAAVTGEMEGSQMDKALSQVTPEEFKKENPNGYALLVSEAVAEKDAKIGEMEVEVKKAEDAKGLVATAMQTLGVEKPEDILSKITELTTRLGDKAKVTVESALDKLLLEKLPGEDNKEKRALVKRLVPVGEMEAKVADVTDATAADKLIGEMLDESFDKDEVVQGIVGEQAPPVVRRREELRNGGGAGGQNDYITDREVVKFGS
jgi:hypothetical protein